MTTRFPAGLVRLARLALVLVPGARARPLVLSGVIIAATMASIAIASTMTAIAQVGGANAAGIIGAPGARSAAPETPAPAAAETTAEPPETARRGDRRTSATRGDTSAGEPEPQPEPQPEPEPEPEPEPARDDRGWLDRAAEALRFETRGGGVRAQVGARLDLEEYFIDQLPPGLIVADEGFFFQPRLTVLLDVQLGRRFVGSVEARADRGFDPGLEPSGDARIDQYVLRYTPRDAPVVNLQAGKFATLFGGWAPRRDSWENPLVNAPVPYENVTTISDSVIPASPAAFLARRGRPDDKASWLPVIWGPSETAGAAVFGSAGVFEYAVEAKNASLASRPADWGAGDGGWSAPTVSARAGWRPSAAWRVGLSFSRGAYLRPEADDALPAGTDREDFPVTIAGWDLTFAGRRIEVWAEAIAARFEVPNVGDAESWSYFVEMKWKLAARWFVAGRWNQQSFGEVPDGVGGEAQWDSDLWRADAALGFRFDRHVQGKVQYGHSHQQGPLQQGEQFAAVQLTIKL